MMKTQVICFANNKGGSGKSTTCSNVGAAMAAKGYMTVDKGSVTVTGVSLTVCEPTDDSFSVAIIPYTFEHTNFHTIEVGTKVNIEFDIIGKYIARIASLQ